MKTKRSNIKGLLHKVVSAADNKLISDIHKEFCLLGIQVNPRLNRAIFDFIIMRTNFLAYKKFESKRKLELNLKARLKLIENVYTQIQRDAGYYENPYSYEFLNRHISVALIEKAVLVAEDLNKNDPRDTLIFGFHLWLFKKALVHHKIEKPVENIAVILEKTGAIQGIGGRWSADTIANKISMAQNFINLSQKRGACHEPNSIGQSPKIRTSSFIKSVSGGCENCEYAWQSTIKIKSTKNSPYEIAAKALAYEMPEVSQEIKNVLKINEDMHLVDILEGTPSQLLKVLAFISN